MIVRVLMTTIRQKNAPPHQPTQHPPSPPRPPPSSPQSNGATRGLRCISRVKGKPFLRPPPDFSTPPSRIPFQHHITWPRQQSSTFGRRNQVCKFPGSGTGTIAGGQLSDELLHKLRINICNMIGWVGVGGGAASGGGRG